MSKSALHTSLNEFNFVLHDALGEGGTASLRFDPMGKGMAQILLQYPIRVPIELAMEKGLIPKQV